MVDGDGLRHGEDEGGFAHAPLGIHYSDAAAHRVLQPPKARSNARTTHTQWRNQGEFVAPSRDLPCSPISIGTSTLSKPATLRGDVAGIGSWRRKCTSNPARTNQLVCAHTSPWVARARVPQLWRTAATGSTQSEAQQQH